MTNQELMAFVKKHPISIGCGLLSVLLVGGIYYRGAQVPDAEEQLTHLSEQSENYKANIKNGAQLKEQLEALVTANKEIDRRIIHASQNLPNQQYFYQLQSDTGVKLVVLNQTTLTVAKPTGKNSFAPIGFSVSVQGTLPQILDFLRRIESGAHYSRVLAATCASSPNKTLTLSLTLELLGLP